MLILRSRRAGDVAGRLGFDVAAGDVGSAQDLAPWLKDALINRDRNLRLQYLAGLGSHLYQSGPIYAEMLTFRKLPQDLFVGSDALKRAVLAGIEAAGGAGQ